MAVVQCGLANHLTLLENFVLVKHVQTLLSLMTHIPNGYTVYQ